MYSEALPVDSSCSKLYMEALFQRGILVTMENPRNFHFWATSFFLKQHWKQVHPFCTDFHACMFGGHRAKQTRIVTNFPQIQQMSIECDGAHSHAPWTFALNREGQRVWATSLESQYPRKLCIALTHIVLQLGQSNGLQLLATSLQDLALDPHSTPQQAQIAIGLQPYRKKIPPIVPRFTLFDLSCPPAPHHPTTLTTASVLSLLRFLIPGGCATGI